MFASSVSSGYGHSSSGQAGTGIQRVKSIGAERVLFPLIIFTHERLSNNSLQPHVGAGMFLHRLASAGHEAWERDTHRGAGGARGEGERSTEGEREEKREYTVSTFRQSHDSPFPCLPRPPWCSLQGDGAGGLSLTLRDSRCGAGEGGEVGFGAVTSSSPPTKPHFYSALWGRGSPYWLPNPSWGCVINYNPSGLKNREWGGGWDQRSLY